MFKSSKSATLVTVLFVIFLLWRFALYAYPADPEVFNVWSFAWGAGYQLLALSGAVIGVLVARSWGGWSSKLGRAAYAFALGLLFQSVGQTASSLYVYFTGEIPYPSWGDIGFFGSIGFYIYGTFMLASVSGVRVSIKSLTNKLLAFFIPLIGLIVAYILFVKGYDYSHSLPLQILLDVGYPLGQVFYVSLAIIVYLLSRNILGGVMRWPILCFIVALAAQYLSDFTFLYQVTRDLYIPEGLNDLMYFVSYFLMAFSLTQLGLVFKKVRNA